MADCHRLDLSRKFQFRVLASIFEARKKTDTHEENLGFWRCKFLSLPDSYNIVRADIAWTENKVRANGCFWHKCQNSHFATEKQQHIFCLLTLDNICYSREPLNPALYILLYTIYTFGAVLPVLVAVALAAV